MATRSNRLVPFRAIHPGEILRDELLERGIKQKDFAKSIGMQASHLNAFIKGKRDMNEELAMKLEAQLGIPFKTWMNLHNGYVYDKKAIEQRNEEDKNAQAFEEDCAKVINLKLLYKKLDMNLLSCSDRVCKIMEMFPFDLRSPEELRRNVAGFYKHSEKVQIDETNMQTWLVLNWLKTSQTEIHTTYNKGNGLYAADKIAKMANERTLTVEAIKQCLNDYGISYVEVEKLEKAPIDAYSTYFGDNPAITVTYRYNDLDKLAFDLLHELCHIENHLEPNGGAFISMEGTLYSKDPKEKEANEFAREHLIPDNIWNDIMRVGSANLSPHRIVNTIAREAEKNGISPSIAVSRYKHDANWYQTSAYKSPKINP